MHCKKCFPVWPERGDEMRCGSPLSSSPMCLRVTHRGSCRVLRIAKCMPVLVVMASVQMTLNGHTGTPIDKEHGTPIYTRQTDIQCTTGVLSPY